MPQDHKLQPQRFEFKYLVPERLTGAMRDFLSGYLELDDYSACQPDYSYNIHSVYLDSDGLHTHCATVNGDKNRFKLRLRYYDDNPGSPVFAEIKQRVDNCILKRRCPIRREAVRTLLHGQMPDLSQVMSDELRHVTGLERFLELQIRLNARPKLHNHYHREAWVSAHDNSVRVTFDRRIQAEPYSGYEAVTRLTRARRLYPHDVVLELKFTTRYPNWFKSLVERFDLMRATASKYSGAIGLLGEQGCGSGLPPLWVADWDAPVPASQTGRTSELREHKKLREMI